MKDYLVFVYLLAKVLRADTGSSISISCRSWLKRLSVTPVSVVEKNDMGELAIISQSLPLVVAWTHPRTVSRSFLWKATPERGTMVMINCLAGS